MRAFVCASSFGTCLFVAPLIAHAGHEVVFSSVPGQPTAVVPLGPALGSAAQFASLSKPFRSPDGMKWLIQGNTNLPSTEDRVLVLFDGTSAATVSREGAQAPWTTELETIGFYTTSMSVNDSGLFAFGNNTSGGASSTDDYVVKFDGTDFIEIAQQGDPIPAGGGNFGATHDSIQILNDGTVAFATTADSGGARFLVGSNVIAQATVTVPGNQAGGAAETVEFLTTGACFVSANGATTMYRADLTGDTAVDLVIVRDGNVVIREGDAVSGMPNTISTFNFLNMMPNGDWFVRGETAVDAENFVIRNGSVIARTGDLIATGAGEVFDDTLDTFGFFFAQGNNVGDYVVGGSTNNKDPNVDAVLVLNGETILAREDDPVDLNNNGIDDDNAYINTFFVESGFLTDEALYFTATLRDNTGTPIAGGQAFIRVPLPPIGDCPADVNGDNQVNVADLLAVISAWGACTDCPQDINDDGVVNVADLLGVIAAWGACP